MVSKGFSNQQCLFHKQIVFFATGILRALENDTKCKLVICIVKINMAKQRSKSDLPTKICPVCDRPFTWRKKWAECWDDVKYCSERCRRRRHSTEN